METSDGAIPGLATDDINPGVYEGGFKTWECAVDLATYLLHHTQYGTKFQSVITASNMRVIEVRHIFSPCPTCTDWFF